MSTSLDISTFTAEDLAALVAEARRREIPSVPKARKTAEPCRMSPHTSACVRCGGFTARPECRDDMPGQSFSVRLDMRAAWRR